MNATFALHNKKRTICIVTGLMIMLLTGLALMPRYLVYADLPKKSDVIVLFVGPERDQDSRFKEAMQLLREEYSGFLFVPDSFCLYKVGPDRAGITAVSFSALTENIDSPGPRPKQEKMKTFFRKKWDAYRIPRFYESTHVEMLLAKKAMDACQFKKAIFVSSPYHMKRIKIMADRVFDSSYDIRLVPTRFEKWNSKFPATWHELSYDFEEIPKMIWYLCYDFNRPAGALP